MSDWTDTIVGDRMTVDRQFNDRVAASEFSSQEWGMIMTAVEFEIEHADTPEDASLVADTDDVEQVMGAVDDVASQMGAMGGAPGGGQQRSGGSGGLFDSIKGALGLGGDDGADDQRLEAARALVDDYANELEAHLKDEGKWERACSAAASADGGGEAADDGTEDETGSKDAKTDAEDRTDSSE